MAIRNFGKQFGRRLGFESLETRAMLDGMVTYSLSSGILTLTGDSKSNAIVVTSSSPGVVQIIGLDTIDPTTHDNMPTTVSGSSQQTLTGVTSIVMLFSGGGGNQGNDAIFATGLNITGYVHVAMASGNNIFGLGDFDNSSNLLDAGHSNLLAPTSIGGGLGIMMLAGNNIITANHLTVTGTVGGVNMNLNVGTGNNSFTFDNSGVEGTANISSTGTTTVAMDNFSAASLAISTSLNNDSISISNSTISSALIIATYYGNDTLTLDNVHAGGVAVNLGPGNDTLTATDVTLVGQATLYGSTDNDTMTLTNFTAAALSVTLYTGNDTLNITGAHITGATSLDGSDGNDSITVNGLSSKSFLATGGAGADTIDLSNLAVTNNLIVRADVGSDNVSLESSSAGAVGIDLGAGPGGNNTLNISGVTTTSVLILGGDGVDTVTLSSITATTLTTALGGGNDVLSAEDCSISGHANLGGGFGNDTFNDLGGNTFGVLVHANIESMPPAPAPVSSDGAGTFIENGGSATTFTGTTS